MAGGSESADSDISNPSIPSGPDRRRGQTACGPTKVTLKVATPQPLRRSVTTAVLKGYDVVVANEKSMVILTLKLA